MSYLTCCKNPSWQSERDLPNAEGFEYILGKCSRCGTPWLNVFCVATSITGYEHVTPGDSEAIRAIQDAQELQDFIRRWGRTNL